MKKRMLLKKLSKLSKLAHKFINSLVDSHAKGARGPVIVLSFVQSKVTIGLCSQFERDQWDVSNEASARTKKGRLAADETALGMMEKIPQMTERLACWNNKGAGH